jgi:hypothetical protein
MAPHLFVGPPEGSSLMREEKANWLHWTSLMARRPTGMAIEAAERYSRGDD